MHADDAQRGRLVLAKPRAADDARIQCRWTVYVFSEREAMRTPTISGAP